MKSLKAKVVALVIICAVVSTCICGGLSLLRTQSVSNQNMAKQMAMQCENSGQEIDTTLIRVEQSVDTLARIMEQSLTDIDKFKTDSRYVEKYTESLRSVALEFANNRLPVFLPAEAQRLRTLSSLSPRIFRCMTLVIQRM